MIISEKIRREIDKQIAAGFSEDEIRQHLLAQEFAAEEIETALKQPSAAAAAGNRSGTAGIISLVVSIYFIISGLIKMSRYPGGTALHTWGVIMLLAGTAGAIWKLSDMLRK